MHKQDSWMNRFARPLDLTRWNYWLGKTNPEHVIEALSYYQNEDGGFGHALEADCWNPSSSPMQTWKATDILREIKCFNRTFPLVEKLANYLTTTMEDGLWPALIPSNNQHPHAPWWHYSEENEYWGYNPSAALLGYLFRLSVPVSKEVHQAINYFLKLENSEMHELPLFMTLYQDLKVMDWDKAELIAVGLKLEDQIQKIMVFDQKRWPEYVFRPSTIFSELNYEFQLAYQDLITAEKAFLREAVGEDGSWDVPWNWGQYPETFALAKTWWKGELNLRYSRFLSL